MVYSIQEILYIWDSYGVFNVLLPFLLIFSIVFGILASVGIFGRNKGINVIIALVVGLLAARSEFMSEFYKEIFPRLGIGVTIILLFLILVGMFIAQDEQRYWFWGIGAIAAVIAIIAVIQTFSRLGWLYGWWYGGDTIAWVIGGVLIVGLIIAVASSSGHDEGRASRQARNLPIYDLLFGPRGRS